MDTELLSRIALGSGVATAALLMLLICFCICKDMYRSWCIRERNRVSAEDIQNVQAIEMLPPGFEEVARVANVLANALVTRQRRQLNPRHDNITSGNINDDGNNDTGTHLEGEASGEKNTGDGDNETENKGTSSLRRKRRVTFNLEEDIDVDSSSKDKKDNKSEALKKGGVKSGSGDDTVDKFDDESSKYDAASGSSTGGGDYKSPSPWVYF